jgi:putative ATPase
VAQQYLPDRALGTQYYRPTANGFEQTVANRLAGIRRITDEMGEQP